MDWNGFMTWVSQLFDKPVVIGSSLIGEIGFIVIFVVSQTSIGKKSLRSLKLLFENADGRVKAAEKTLAEFKKEKEDQIQRLVQSYEDRLSVATDEVLALEGLLSKVAEAMPNKKVKDAINSFMEGKAERLQAIAEKIPTGAEIGELREKLEEKEQEVLSIRERAEASIDALKAEYEEKSAKVEELLAKLGNAAQEAATEVENG